MVVTRTGTAVTGTARFAPSNFFRELTVDQDINIKGREFVVDADSLATIVGLGIIKRGDVLTDPVLGRLSISEVREMYDLGAGIIGYRIRTT
jgi:hypothetical protein